MSYSYYFIIVNNSYVKLLPFNVLLGLDQAGYLRISLVWTQIDTKAQMIVDKCTEGIQLSKDRLSNQRSEAIGSEQKVNLNVNLHRLGEDPKPSKD